MVAAKERALCRPEPEAKDLSPPTPSDPSALLLDDKSVSSPQDANRPPARHPRRDGLPEHTHYPDTGCRIHPSCLTCPLVRCRYEEPGGARRLFSRDRDLLIVRLTQTTGLNADAIALRVGV